MWTSFCSHYKSGTNLYCLGLLWTREIVRILALSSWSPAPPPSSPAPPRSSPAPPPSNHAPMSLGPDTRGRGLLSSGTNNKCQIYFPFFFFKVVQLYYIYILAPYWRVQLIKTKYGREGGDPLSADKSDYFLL